MRNRSRTEIISSILRSTGNGATKTQLMYRAYLSYSQVHEYLRFLQERGLMSYEEGTHHYKVTKKGVQFLKAADRAESLVSAAPEKPTETVQSLSELA